VNPVTRSFSRLLAWSLVVILLTAGALAYWQWLDYQRFADAPISLVPAERILEVERGDAFVDVLTRMRAIGIDEGHAFQWRLLALEMDVLRRLQVGEYAVGHGITPRQLLHKLESGRVVQHRFTLVEGWRFSELRAALASNPAIKQTLDGVADDEVMALLERPGQHPEGRFLPETYLFTRGTPDIELLRRSLLAMERTLADVWDARQPELPIESAEQALILASLIEKETGSAGERREIAGVFVRRMRLGMRLQTDPSVIYGMGERYRGRIGRAGLDTDTPYNTYTRDGLPPTPIAMPGRAALRAAVDPAPGDSLYFVSKGDGSHHFSRTLAEHNRAVNRYIRRGGAASQGEAP
jgi:UPF0755 protein